MNNDRADTIHKKIKKPVADISTSTIFFNVQHMRIMIINVLRRVDPLLRKFGESVDHELRLIVLEK